MSAVVSQRDHSLADVTFLSVAVEMSGTINRPISGRERCAAGAVYLAVLQDSVASSSPAPSFRTLFLRGFSGACKEKKKAVKGKPAGKNPLKASSSHLGGRRARASR